jgi:hypothetical protein
MHLAAINDKADALSLLQEYGADFGIRDSSGRTPLRLAKKHMRMIAVRCLERIMGHETGGGSDTEVSSGELEGYDGVNGTAKVPPEEMAEFLEKRHKAKESTARRKKLYGVPEEKRDKDGLTASQRHHMERLVNAARVNAQTGIPMEKILDPKADVPDQDEENRRRFEAMQRAHDADMLRQNGGEIDWDPRGPPPGVEGPALPPDPEENLESDEGRGECDDGRVSTGNGYVDQPVSEEFPEESSDVSGDKGGLRNM